MEEEAVDMSFKVGDEAIVIGGIEILGDHLRGKTVVITKVYGRESEYQYRGDYKNKSPETEEVLGYANFDDKHLCPPHIMDWKERLECSR